ncbi:MAG TPA: PVC-type heme-binding CxxCH protein, partial [Candidatus Saccharimonadales bacterium]|nr:PVC-type heme-binding CxxCH protein [Candidatus Saccharimonadales bacterium]
DFSAETGGGQHGLSFDNEGHKYICHNSDHIRLVMYQEQYANRNPYYNMPPPVVSIAVDGPAAEVYRISPDEPWRVLRTQWRVSGKVPGLIEGGGRASGYFTSAAGITIYRGSAFPPDYVGDAFIADVGSNLIHRKKIKPDGASFKAERAAGEEKIEFIASKDLWFRPVQFANAPDGTLYVADMYREVIEHPWSIPESIKKHLDLNSGNDRGRIYRIAPDGFKQPSAPRLGEQSSQELVTLLSHPNGWHRDTAARLLYERQDKSIIPALEAMAKSGRTPLGRLHALYALQGHKALKGQHLIAGLKDPQPVVREHALKLIENSGDETLTRKILPELQDLAADRSPRVRYQLAFTLGILKGVDVTPLLAKIIHQDFNNSWIKAAVLSSIGNGASEMLDLVWPDKILLNDRPGQEFVRQLVLQIGAAHQKEQIDNVVHFLSQEIQPAFLFSLVRSLSEGLARGGSSLAKSKVDLNPVLQRAEAVAMDSGMEEATRLSALELMSNLPFSQAGEKLLSLLSARQAEPLQLAALHALKQYPGASVAAEVLKHWRDLTPRLRSEVLAALLERPERTLELLASISRGDVQANELTANQVQFLLAHKQKEVREAAAQCLGKTPKLKRADVVEAFLAALDLKGEARRGRTIYEQRCISCHRAGNLGSAVGPDLVTVKTAGREKLLINILDPNREVAPNYFSYLVETTAGDSIPGILARETGGNVVLRQAFGKEEIIPRNRIASMKNQGQSLMPEGLEMGLTPQDMADLLDFIERVESSGK